jgi:hypothetical protein
VFDTFGLRKVNNEELDNLYSSADTGSYSHQAEGEITWVHTLHGKGGASNIAVGELHGRIHFGEIVKVREEMVRNCEFERRRTGE